MRVTIWVRPGSAHAHVGGNRGGALAVRVKERATGGRATEAALAALAAALGVRRSAVRLVSGASGRAKMVDIVGADPAAVACLLADGTQ